MKSGIHPDYHPVVFCDASTRKMFLTRSTATSSRTIEWQTPEGVQAYPLINFFATVPANLLTIIVSM
jgi:large subunit ribosomal protein L31